MTNRIWRDEDGPFCCECGEPCSTGPVDFGIGDYECHGVVGHHSVIVEVSDCCEAEFTEHDWVAEQILEGRGDLDEGEHETGEAEIVAAAEALMDGFTLPPARMMQ